MSTSGFDHSSKKLDGEKNHQDEGHYHDLNGNEIAQHARATQEQIARTIGCEVTTVFAQPPKYFTLRKIARIRGTTVLFARGSYLKNLLHVLHVPNFVSREEPSIERPE